MSGTLSEAAFARVGDPAWLRAQGLFVAEGRFVTTRLLQSSRFRARIVLLTPAALTAMAAVLDGIETARRPDVFVRTQAELDALTGFRLHQGCVALADRPSELTMLPTDLEGPVVVLERVRDPDNVGSIMRSALAFGAGGLLLGPDCADPFYRKAIRTSMGAVFTLPVATTAEWPAALDTLKSQGRAIVALALGPEALTPDDAARRLGGQPLALVAGSEGEGLTQEALATADYLVRIPMTPFVDSLNVAVATAVALYSLTGSNSEGTR